MIGARAIVGHLQRLNVQPLPSRATIQRILAKHGLTHPLGSNHAAAYYPWPVPWAINAIQATALMTKHLRGGEVIQNFPTLDLSSHAVTLTQHWDKTTVTATTHLLTAWAHLGRPLVHQFDNESPFGGGPTHARVLGHVVRLCLYCQIEPFFTPVYDAKRNHQSETFHSLWVAAFWSRQAFASLAEVQTEVRLFLRWYRPGYQPPALTPPLRSLIPGARLPLTAGRIHVMRKVDLHGTVTLLNEPWLVGKRWMGEYIRATIDTALQQVSFWHKPDATANWRHLKTRQFRLQETVHEAVPEFRRNSARCREYFPS